MDNDARPNFQRELLIDDIDNWLRTDLREKLDPQIDTALDSRGYIEDRNGNGRIHLEHSHLLLSRPFLQTYSARFDGLSTFTQYSVEDTVKTMREGQLELFHIGGFDPSIFRVQGEKYETKTYKTNTDPQKVPFKTLSKLDAEEIIQDIRAHTTLGYSASNSFVPVSMVIDELEALNSIVSIDQRASYRPFSSIMDPNDYSELQINIGKTFELTDVKRRGKLQKRMGSIARFLEVTVEQPIVEGTLKTGIHFSSGNEEPRMKITTVIDSPAFSEEDKQRLYDEQVRRFQEDEITKFGHIALHNLAIINDQNSDIIRIA